MPAEHQPVSAAALAAMLGEALPSVASVPPAAYELVRCTRALIDAVVMTDTDETVRRQAAAAIAGVTTSLLTNRRAQPLLLVRHADGQVESLLQAGSGRLNPAAPPLRWTRRPTEPPAGAAPVLRSVHALCTFTAAHAGSPGRVHGGVLASVLDEVLGTAVTASGASGMTVSLTVTLRGPTPIDHEVELTARCTGHEGRKSFAEGAVLVGGVPTAEARAIFVGERRPPAGGAG